MQCKRGRIEFWTSAWSDLRLNGKWRCTEVLLLCWPSTNCLNRCMRYFYNSWSAPTVLAALVDVRWCFYRAWLAPTALAALSLNHYSTTNHQFWYFVRLRLWEWLTYSFCGNGGILLTVVPVELCMGQDPAATVTDSLFWQFGRFGQSSVRLWEGSRQFQ